MVILTPNGKDPDESIKVSPLEFKKAVKEEVGVYDYLFNLALNSFDKNKIEGKKKIADEILPVINGVENEIIKEHYLRKLSNEINSSYETILRQMEKIGKKEVHTVQKPQDVNLKKDRREILEEYLLSLILQSEKAKEKLELSKKLLGNYEFRVKACQKIIEHLEIYFKNINEFDSIKFSRALPEELMPTFDVCFLFPISKTDDEKKENEEIGKIIKDLLALDLKDKIRNLSDKMKKEENETEAEALKKKLSELLSNIDNSKN
jgi:DNA primase